MKKLLLIGINTRSMVNSALKLNYEVYTVTYFQCSDFPEIENSIAILKEESNTSSGSFEMQYNPQELLKNGEEFLEIADLIILTSGISAGDFSGKYKKYVSKIIGNKKVSDVEDKYRFYKKIKNKYLTPETFIINDIDEVFEIIKNNPLKKYIIKPTLGSGGYDVNLLNKETLNQLNYIDESWIIQEYISGKTISSSVLSTKKDRKQIATSQILTGNDFNQRNYVYIGNIVPLANEKTNNNLKSLSENLIKDFKLIGSNGVDFIENDEGIYVIEINPRLQGTYECIERVLNINLLEAHIEAINGNLIDVGKVDGYSYKKILYAKEAVKYKKLNIKNIYDRPYEGSITEKDEPLLTIIEKNENLKKLIESVNNTSLKIEKELYNTN